ncbi:MAG: hypothetical protein KatS3mg104_2937 [Phycisphaerae bacterium]|nr:MAG: hypothetical protein KatS3mg104_2937 [Phycisphaerae bacterium]
MKYMKTHDIPRKAYFHFQYVKYGLLEGNFCTTSLKISKPYILTSSGYDMITFFIKKSK